jgi:ribonuclease HII
VLYFEKKLKEQGNDLIIGVDEAGRGPLAGPVVAAAVILNTIRFKNRIDDSKKLTPLARENAFREIVRKSIFGVAIVNETIIDRINILEASRLAMKQAISCVANKVNPKKQRIFVIADGNMTLDIDLPYTSIVRGDSRSLSIASASILAKVIRDQIMNSLDLLYPAYNFKQHKGYPTKEHRKILKQIGASPIHRKSFSCA